ncbi:hypothetical protein [Pontibacter flavimaris]|uniref:STAS/SEC14 domain-containing protein n=1 Tax=Pontibacter flavimaris TaxID=1797110 RepID=A0A1Q5P8A7_9BACT|nr:hypothetical protein [Pontibacter flavimaris]OKL38423.1 hypothetical protein A3841_06805 [Pontibacter flavimaris]
METREKEKVTLVKENSDYTIKVYLSLSLLTLHCKRHMGSEEVRQTCMALLEIVDAYKVKYLMSNARALHYLSMEDANWVWNHTLTALRASTILKWARVEGPASMVELNSLQVRRRLEAEGVKASELQFESFVEEESALHWLLDNDA